MSIFISIASYCDPYLALTMEEAYTKATWPDALHFGIIDQSPIGIETPIPKCIPQSQITYIKIDSSQARGASWARSLAMSVMGRQDLFLQIDSHMIFEQDWDDTLMAKANALMTITPDCVLSSYPPSFKIVDGVPTPQGSSQRLIAHVVAPDATFEEGHPVLRFRGLDLYGMAAAEGYLIAGGCIFASADYVHKLPWDPFLYFNEEEASAAIRLYTHGWTIYHAMGMPIFHLYSAHDGAIKRPMHWDKKEGAPEDATVPLWSRLINRARRRMNVLVSEDSSSLGVYGLGTKRTLQDYAEQCGIDYLNRTLAPKAFSGPWPLSAQQK